VGDLVIADKDTPVQTQGLKEIKPSMLLYALDAIPELRVLGEDALD